MDDFLHGRTAVNYKWDKIDCLTASCSRKWELSVTPPQGNAPTKKWLTIMKTENSPGNGVSFQLFAATRFEKGDVISVVTFPENNEINQTEPNGKTLGLGGDWAKKVFTQNDDIKQCNAMISNEANVIRAVSRIMAGTEIIVAMDYRNCHAWWELTWLDLLLWDSENCAGGKLCIGRVLSYSKSSEAFTVRFDNGNVKNMTLHELQKKLIYKYNTNETDDINHDLTNGPLLPHTQRKRGRNGKRKL